MSTPALEFEWQSDVRALREAMLLAGKFIYTDVRWLYAVLNILMGALVAMGGAGFVLLISILGWQSTDPGLPALMGGTIAAVLFLLAMQRMPITLYARRAVTSAFGQGPQRAQADPSGITFLNDKSAWQSKWSGVNEVYLGKKGIAISVSGIAFSIPRAAFPSRDAMAETAAQFQAWHGAAT
ncbi:MAG: hypothetical protein AAF744_07485 [Pseudomonadota bacterium]